MPAAATIDTRTNTAMMRRGERIATRNNPAAMASSFDAAVFGSAPRQDRPAVQMIIDVTYAASMPMPPNQPRFRTTGNPDVVSAMNPAAVVTDVSRHGPITAASPWMTRSRCGSDRSCFATLRNRCTVEEEGGVRGVGVAVLALPERDGASGRDAAPQQRVGNDPDRGKVHDQFHRGSLLSGRRSRFYSSKSVWL